MDQGDTAIEIGPGIAVNDTGPNILAYGALGNADALYFGSGAQVFIRMAASVQKTVSTSWFSTKRPGSRKPCGPGACLPA